MKKIIVFSPSNKGTIAFCSANIIRTLKEEKVNVLPIVLYKEEGGFEEYNNCKYIVDKTKYSGANISFFQKLKKYKVYKKEFGPDITISTLVSVNTLNVLSGGKDIKIGIFHSPLEQTKNVSYLNYLRCLLTYKFLFKKLDYLYAVSVTTQKDAERHIGRKVQVVYNIHNFSEIHRLSEVELSKEEECIFKKPTVLYVGHLYDTKGVQRLLNAFSKIKKEANLVLVGSASDGTIPSKYIDIANNVGIGDKTFFLGYQSNPYKYMRNCTVFCLPSYSEGLPGVIIETLSLNKRVITTNSSIGVWEILQCIKDYNEGVKLPFANELGIITSNDDLNNECVNQLTNAIDKELDVDEKILQFDKSRFEGRFLVKYFTLENNEK